MNIEQAMVAAGGRCPEDQEFAFIASRREGDGELCFGFEEDVTAEELTQVLTATMAKVAELPDFDPLAFQGQLMAAMTQGVGG